MLVVGTMINKTGYGKEYIATRNEFYQGEFENGLRNGRGRLITDQLQVFDGEWKKDEILPPIESDKYIQRKVYEKMIYYFLKKQDTKEPHIVIIS